MSIYVKTNDSADEIQDTYSRLSALEHYETAIGTQICSNIPSDANLNYMYFKRYGKMVIVFGRIGIGKFPGIWNSLAVAKITAERWLPRTEGICYPCVNQNGIGFDISIGTDGYITFNQRGVNSTTSTDTWMTGTVVYICK